MSAGACAKCGGDEGGRGIVKGLNSGPIAVITDEATDAGNSSSSGSSAIGGTALDAEVKDVSELRIEESDGIDLTPSKRQFTLGALTRTGVLRGRMGDKTRVIASGFARSSFVTISYGVLRSKLAAKLAEFAQRADGGS